MRTIYTLLLLLTFQTLLHAQKKAIKNSFGIKLNLNSSSSSEYSFDDSLNLYSETPFSSTRKFTFSPSFFIENKKSNLWEFGISLGGIRKIDEYVRYNHNIFNVPSSLYINGSKVNSLDVKIGAISHLNLAKKSKKLRAFLSLDYELGLERNKLLTYTTLAFNRKSTFASLGLGLSTRLGYNITEKLFIEVTPPLHLSVIGRVGRQFLDLYIPEFQRSTPILDIYPQVFLVFIPTKSSNGFTDRTYSNILSIGYIF